ncbi:hypothetical protein SAMN05444722_0367 [Rhodovulum sp. ES.010]|nr:hypothetical protein [Rhodovulum sp. ES.010]SIO08685.1 hypothetical protein SAMN05444722_0367 [Rhodovulum sp. ES.010]
MSNRAALGLFALIVTALCADYALNGFSATLFLARKFVDLTNALAVWR